MEIKIVWYTLQGLITMIGGWVGWYTGGTDGLLLALVAFTLIDYVTGVFAAAATKQLSSKTGFTGIARKITIFLLVGLANLLDVYLIKEGHALRGATLFFYLTNEGISILENTTRLGLPVPPALAEALRMVGARHNPTNPANQKQPTPRARHDTPTPTSSQHEVTPASTQTGSSTYQARHTSTPTTVRTRRGRHAATTGQPPSNRGGER